jgi:hypothetical protein
MNILQYSEDEDVMPLQNRVNQFGEILALPMRGAFTGNRGIIHDPATKTLTKRRWSSKAWIVCACAYNGIRRDVMATRSWTELFFLDEATALAAGHRPCFYCRRSDAQAFQASWAQGNGEASAAAPHMDAVLHRERLQSGSKRLNVLLRPLEDLPDGAMISAGGSPFVVASGKAHLWSPEGYTKVDRLPFVDGLLTPPSTLNALLAGYRVNLHSSLSKVPKEMA